MDNFPSTNCFSQGTNIYEVVGGQYLVPVIQTGANFKAPTAYSNQTIPFLQSTTLVPTGYQVINVTAPGNISQQGFNAGRIGCSSEKEFPLKHINPAAKDQVVNPNYGVISHGVISSVQASSNIGQTKLVPDTSQINRIRSDNYNYKIITNYQANWNNGRHKEVNFNKEAAYKKQCKGPVVEPCAKKLSTQVQSQNVKISSAAIKKIGNLKIHISETFSPWDMKGKTILDLNFMRHIFDINSVDITFENNCTYVGVYEAIKNAEFNRILSDWIILKCEEKQMPFFKVNDQLEIYTVDNFSHLVSIIALESCLPLPYFSKEEGQDATYFYINFPKMSNNKVTKLNEPIFHDADNGTKKLFCKHPGIRLDCTFEGTIRSFTIYVQRSAVSIYEANATGIRLLLIYNHVVWGYLQSWTRRVKESFNNCFQLEDIAKNIILCRNDRSHKSKTNSNDNVYPIGFMNCYLKFDPGTLKDTKLSFTLENFETSQVSNVPIVQYYRQFFLINDLHYSNAQRNILLLFKRMIELRSKPEGYSTNERPKDGSQKGASKDAAPNPSPARTDSFDEGSRLVNSFAKNIRKEVEPSRLVDGPKAEKICLKIQISNAYKTTVRDKSATLEVKNAVQSKKTECTKEGQRITKGLSAEPEVTLKKPLIKTRTVEEINASILGDVRPTQNSCGGSSASELLQKFNVEGNAASKFSLVREHLNQCFLKYRKGSRAEDETKDPRIMKRRYEEAVVVASTKRSLAEFMDELYSRLRLHFTNETCKNILKEMMFQEVDEKMSRFPVKRDSAELNLLENPVPDGVTPPAVAEQPEPPVITIDEDSPEPDAVPPRTEAQARRETPKQSDCTGESNETSPPPVPTSAPAAEVTIQLPEGDATAAGSRLSEVANAVEPAADVDGGSFENILYTDTYAEDSSASTELFPEDSTTFSGPLAEDSSTPAFSFVHDSPIASTGNPAAGEDANPNNDSSTETEVIVDRGGPSEDTNPKWTDESYLSKYNIKPCYVVLDRRSVSNYKRGRKRRRKDGSSSNESKSNPVTKRAKKITELEYMEARTRVLQRLRRRQEMYIGNTFPGLYTSEELEEFFVRRNSLSHRNNSEESEKSNKENEAGVVPRCEDHLKKEIRIVLSRLEDTPEFRHYREKLNLRKRKNSASLSADRGRTGATERDGQGTVTKNNSKYFEVRDGNLYLKEQFCVNNGVIVPSGCDSLRGIRLKEEPPLVQGETDILRDFLKIEVDAD